VNVETALVLEEENVELGFEVSGTVEGCKEMHSLVFKLFTMMVADVVKEGRVREGNGDEASLEEAVEPERNDQT